MSPAQHSKHLATVTNYRLGIYGRETWDYPTNTVSGFTTVAFMLLVDTKLLSQAGITHYSQLHDTAALY